MSPNQTPSIVVVGSLNRDLVVTVPGLPLPGETVHGTSYAQHNGGKGANQAVALARLGQRVTMVGCVGNDEDGSALVSALQAEGVDTRFVSRSSTRTGVAFITVEDIGQNSIVVVAGANGDLDEAAIDAAAEVIGSADIVLAQFEVPIPSVARALSHATGTVVLNPAPASRFDEQLLKSVDYLIPNRTELATLAGSQSPRNDSEVLESIELLSFDGVVVVTLGSDGARVVHGGEVIASATPPTVDVVDTVGAGDAFCAGFCDALARGLPLPEAVTWATTCGALAATSHGAQASMPTAEAVEAVLAN